MIKSIQTKFIILIVGCVLLTSVVIGGAGILSAKRAVDADSARIMNLLCKERAQIIDAQLSRIEQSVKTLAIFAMGQLESARRLQTDDAYVEDYTRRLQSVAINAASNTEGAMAVYVRFNPEFSKPTSGLFWSKTALNGSFQEHEPTDFSRFNPNDTERVGWYYIPVKNGRPTWLAPYLNKNLNVEMISYVIPIYMGSVTVGVIGMDIDFNVVKEVVRPTRVYESGYAFLVDEQAQVLSHPEVAMGSFLQNLDQSLFPVSESLKNSSSMNFLFPYSWQGAEKRLSFYALRNGMRLIVCAPITEIDNAKDTLIVQIALASITIISFAVLLTILITRRMIKPLRELNVAAQKIASGDLSISFSPQTKDEVGTLADSFQQTVNHLRQYIDYINSLAYRDGLTGVKNNSAYKEAADRLEKKARTERAEFAVVMMDINGLKAVNDTYGHDSGDLLIIDSCKIICKIFNHSPVYRIGGDEFVVLLESADFQSHTQLLDKFQMAVDDYNKYTATEHKISIAIGIAVYNEAIDLTFQDVFKRADEAMYQNKIRMKENEAASCVPASSAHPAEQAADGPAADSADNPEDAAEKNQRTSTD